MGTTPSTGMLRNTHTTLAEWHDIAHLRQEFHNSKILHFWVIGMERNICRCNFNRYSFI